MGAWSKHVALALWLAGPGAAAAEPADAGCAELRAIVAAAQEEPPFGSMIRDTPFGALGFSNCEVLSGFVEGDSPRFICVGEPPQSFRRWRQINFDVVRCLPGATERYVDPAFYPGPERHHAEFRVGPTLINTTEEGVVGRRQRYVAIHIEVAEDR